jgi:hypothetical protein
VMKQFMHMFAKQQLKKTEHCFALKQTIHGSLCLPSYS